jgi:biopolymer transport protein ExbD/biopolymer transport protein TolR
MNVTPLVDVVLVLLIVFMVVAPHLQYDIAVNLPSVGNPDPVSESSNQALQITMVANGGVYIDGKAYSREETLAQLQAAHAADPLRRMIIRADEQLSYGQVRALCTQAQQIGFPGVAMMVNERPQSRNS